MKTLWIKVLIGFFGTLTLSQVLLAAVEAKVSSVVAPRELIIVKAAKDQIWGNAVVAVINRGKDPEELSFRGNIPKEAVDFRASEGLTAADLVLGGDGVGIKKTFAAGVNVVGVSFAVNGKDGLAKMTFNPGRAVAELIFMTPAGLLIIESPQLNLQGTEVQEGERVQVYTLKSPLAEGEVLEVAVKGVPIGRTRLWWMGGAFGVLLVLGAGVLSFKTRPSVLEGSKEGGLI